MPSSRIGIDECYTQDITEHSEPSGISSCGKESEVASCGKESEVASCGKHFFVHALSAHHDDTEILKDLTFSVHAGTILSIMGPNGGGKTTLFHTLSGIRKPASGHWGWQENGKKYALKQRDWTYLPQRFQGDRSFPLRVQEFLNISHPTLSNHDISAALDQFKLGAYVHARIQSLSEGQFQRLLFARLWIKPTPIIFLDEPFAGLDERIIDDLIEVIQQWKDQGRIILLSHHNRLRALQHFPDTLLLARNQYICGTSTDILTPERWQSFHDSICSSQCC
jgi:zinc/manganese transport system ATP-binding protein